MKKNKLKLLKDPDYRRKMKIFSIENHPAGNLDLSVIKGGGCTTPGNNSCTPIRGCGILWSVSGECNGGKSCWSWLEF